MLITTYDYIDSNKRKTILLILLFPISLLMLIFIALFVYSYIDLLINNRISNENILVYVFNAYWYYFFLTIIASIIWTIIAFYYGNSIVLNCIYAKKPKEDEYRDTKRIIENVSITAGIKPPQLYIMEGERSLNAFTVGTSIEKSCIVLTSGIIEKLERSELEAVIAHEVAHVIHHDTRLMMATVLMIGFFSFLGSFLMSGFSSRRGGNVIKRGKSGGIIILIGVVLYIYGNLVAPAIRLAISRTREYLADSKAALLTRNPQALISALEKIDKHPIIDYFSTNEIMSPMCIVSPLRIQVSLFKALSNLSNTHPPIEERIQALEVMDGRSFDF